MEMVLFMRKLIMMLGVSTALCGITGGASAAPVSYHVSSPHDAAEEDNGQSLLAGYEQDGLTLRDDQENHRLLIGVDPASFRSQVHSGTNQYHLAVRDVLSAAASYAYLYFGQHPNATNLTVEADIENDAPVTTTGGAADNSSQQPALSFDIPRPTFPITADSKPDAYSARMISQILGMIDPAQATIAPWLRASLQPSAQKQ